MPNLQVNAFEHPVIVMREENDKGIIGFMRFGHA